MAERQPLKVRTNDYRYFEVRVVPHREISAHIRRCPGCVKSWRKGETVYGLVCHVSNICFLWERQSAKNWLDTVIHEALHMQFPSMSEQRVEDAANFIARLQRALGPR